MAEKHYNASYLVDTVEILGQLKYNSYRHFESLSENSTVLDLGCGTGQDVINMATFFEKRKFSFIGVDHDPSIIQNNNSTNLKQDNIKFLISDALSLPFSDSEIDGVRMERLVQHISETSKLFCEVYRVMNNEGVLIIMESDWRSLSFYNGDTSTMNKIVSYLVSTKIKNGNAAQLLTSDLKRSNFKNIKLDVYPFVLKSYNEACKYLWMDKMLGEMLELQIIDQSEHDNFVQHQIEADKLNCFACTMNIVIATAIK